MKLTNIKARQKDSGFTIVELLVVIVVIGILAAITIVSYTGITARANTASAQSAANAVQAKAEVYYADSTTNLYPDNLGKMTVTATSDKTYYIPASTATFSGTLLAANPSPVNTVNFFRCGHKSSTSAAPASLAEITTVTGNRIAYWDFQTGIKYVDNGQVSGTTATTNYMVSCYITTVVGT